MFDNALELILKHEGGYVDHPTDPGGETNFGISKRAYPDLDIKNISQAEVSSIYKKDYWDKIKGDELPYPLALFAFDCAVNSGVSRSSKWLQECVKAEPIDGVIGSITLALTQKTYQESPTETVNNFVAQRTDFIRDLSTYSTFGKGWERRIQETKEECLKWIETL